MVTYWIEGKQDVQECQIDDPNTDAPIIDLSPSPQHQPHQNHKQELPNQQLQQEQQQQGVAINNLTANSINSVFLDEDETLNISAPSRGPANGDVINMMKPAHKVQNSPSSGTTNSHISLPGEPLTVHFQCELGGDDEDRDKSCTRRSSEASDEIVLV